MSSTTRPPDLVVAVGPTAQGMLPRVWAATAELPRVPTLLGLSAEFPAPKLKASWRARVYDLGSLANDRRAWDWCRSVAQRGGSQRAWNPPADGNALDPLQCELLYRFHRTHGLLKKFWQLALPRSVETVHVVTCLQDGAGAVIPELLGDLESHLEQREAIHVHLLTCEPSTLNVSNLSLTAAWTGYSLGRLCRHDEHETEHLRVNWLLRWDGSHGGDGYEQVAGFLGHLCGCRTQEPLHAQFRRWKDAGVWRPELPVVWGNYDVQELPKTPDGLRSRSREWLRYGLPPTRFESTRRLLVHGNLPETLRESISYDDPGLQMLEASWPSHAETVFLAWLCLGFWPHEHPDWNCFAEASLQLRW